MLRISSRVSRGRRSSWGVAELRLYCILAKGLKKIYFRIMLAKTDEVSTGAVGFGRNWSGWRGVVSGVGGGEGGRLVGAGIYLD